VELSVTRFVEEMLFKVKDEVDIDEVDSRNELRSSPLLVGTDLTTST